MSTESKQRLFKIASEINIGKETIVEFLKAKGFDIENKPTATLTGEMVEVIYDKFKREKKAAEKQREKIQKQKDIRKVPSEKELPELHHEIKGREEVHHKVEEKHEPPIPMVVTEEIKPVETITVEIVPEIVSVAVEPKVEKIELPPDTKPKKGKPAPPKEAEPAPVIEVAEAPKEVEAIVAPEVVPEPPKKEEEKPVQKETKSERPPTPSEGALDHRKKKKVKKYIEIEVESDENEPKQQGGLKIIGRIDLQSTRRHKDRQRPKQGVTPTSRVADEGDSGDDTLKSKLSKLKKKTKVKGIPEKVIVPTDTPEKTSLIEEKKKKKKKKTIREQISQEEVDRAIRRTLSGMEDHHLSMRSKLRQKKKLEREEKELKIAEEKERQEGILELTEFVTTNDLANLMGVSTSEIIIKCMQLGLMVTINQRLDKETLIIIADDYGFEVNFVEQETLLLKDEEEDSVEDLKPRPPIVTIMGHVDHGKTSLLDYIRHANVVAGEAGGITQHIAAYKVKTVDGRLITFLDTPGHEAFTAMRARGAQVTDIVVLVVAADDSVMPQTIEAISHAQAANVPIIVAINKIDKPDSRPDRIKQQLADHKILVEEWGGKNQSVEISAKFGINVDQLLDKILLEAELLELKANPNRKAKGTIIESHMAKGLGTVSTLIVQKGTLKIGDPFVAGAYSGKVRVMLDERGNRIEEAGPSIPVGVIGFDGLPEAGDIFLSVDSDSEAKSTAIQRQQLRREQELRQVRHVTLDEISKQIQIGGVKDLKLILKGDVAGSVEALSDSLTRLSRDEVRVDIIHKGVGNITESDVMLAIASGAVVIGFQVSPTTKARKLADNESVDIRQYNIIYDCINEIQLALEGLLTPEIKEEITSSVEIRKVYKISKTGNIAGCYVQSGKITRNDKIRVLRNGLPVFTGYIHSLKRNKDDVREVDQGYECGIQVEGYNAIEEGDFIEGFKQVEIKRRLD